MKGSRIVSKYRSNVASFCSMVFILSINSDRTSAIREDEGTDKQAGLPLLDWLALALAEPSSPASFRKHPVYDRPDEKEHTTFSLTTFHPVCYLLLVMCARTHLLNVIR